MKFSLSLGLAFAGVSVTAYPTLRDQRTMQKSVQRPETWVGSDKLQDLSGQVTASRVTDTQLDANPRTDLPFPIAWYTQAAALAQGAYCTGSMLDAGTTIGDAKLLSHTGDGTGTQQSLVYISDSLGVVLAYQGTNSSALESLWHDVDFLWTEPDEALGTSVSKTDSLVDRGFQHAFLATWSTVQTLVSDAQKQYPNRNFTIVGHSLGAAIAELAAVAYGTQANTVITCTFAPPSPMKIVDD